MACRLRSRKSQRPCELDRPRYEKRDQRHVIAQSEHFDGVEQRIRLNGERMRCRGCLLHQRRIHCVNSSIWVTAVFIYSIPRVCSCVVVCPLRKVRNDVGLKGK